MKFQEKESKRNKKIRFSKTINKNKKLKINKIT